MPVHFPATLSLPRAPACSLVWRAMAEAPMSGAETDREPLHSDVQTEYWKINDAVNGFDQRLLVIKGWGVTLSLASLGLGFQNDHYGLFLVAAVSGLAFWALEGTTKGQQMRYYPRMRDIEVAAYHGASDRSQHDGTVSSPLLDWSWDTAIGGDSGDEPRRRGTLPRWYRRWTYPHVMLPHLVAVVVGTILFGLGLAHVFQPI